MPSRVLAFVVFAALVAVVAYVGSRFMPGEWYEALRKAPWTPPNAVFAPVWTVLYVAIAVAGALVWRSGGDVAAPLALWLAQLVLNGAWSWLFFGRHDLGLALLDIAALLAAIVAFIVLALPATPIAAWLFVPYGLWVLYASTLNLYAWLFNSMPAGGFFRPPD